MTTVTTPQINAATSISMPRQLAVQANTTQYLPLGSITPDLRQPRRWLPADIRAGLGKKWKTGVDAMQELLKRAGQGDLEAQGYLRSLKSFADDIMEVGLQVPISVFLLPEGGAYRYMVKHGERRWWACLYLAATSDLPPGEALATTIESFAEPEDSGQTADDVRRTQWSENLQREDVAPMDVICEVSAVYDSAYSKATLQRAALLQELSWADEEQAASVLAVAYAQNVLQAHMGKTFSRSSILSYAQLAEKIGSVGQGLARAFHFSVRDLKRLAQASSAGQQDAWARSLAEATLKEQPVKVATVTSSTLDRGQTKVLNTGRPTRARQFVSLCLKLPEQLAKGTDRQLAQLKATELQEMIEAARQARMALDEYCKRLSSTLARPGLAETN